MAPKLTIEEKKARGTHQACLDPEARAPEEITAEITFTRRALASMQANFTRATEAIEELGTMVTDEKTRNDNTVIKIIKVNPAFKLQKEMLTAVKQLNRALVLLREELALAESAAAPAHDEFEGL